MMKRCISLLLLLAICFSFAACGADEQTDKEKEFEEEHKDHVVITEDMYEEIADSIADYISYMLLIRCNMTAEARAEAGMKGYEDGVEFDDYSIGKTEQIDDYTVKTFGKLHGETKYGDDFTTTYEVVAVCKKDSESEKGYKVSCDSFFG